MSEYSKDRPAIVKLIAPKGSTFEDHAEMEMQSCTEADIPALRAAGYEAWSWEELEAKERDEKIAAIARGRAAVAVRNELCSMRFEGLDDTLLTDLRILVWLPAMDQELIKAGYDHLVKLESERPAKIAARVRARLEGGE